MTMDGVEDQYRHHLDGEEEDEALHQLKGQDRREEEGTCTCTHMYSTEIELPCLSGKR